MSSVLAENDVALWDAALALADLAAGAVAYPRLFHENTNDRQQRLSQAVARVRLASRATSDMVEVAIRCEDPEGNDAWEETASFRRLPQIGETIEVWVGKQEDRPWCQEYPIWLVIKDIIHCSYDPRRIEVWVSSDAHSDDEMRRIFAALRRGDQP